VNYEEWERSVPREITEDSLWRMEAYRLGLFIADVGWHDVTKLMRDKRTLNLSDQLYRALGSISANLAEGYSRGTGKDRARFYEYALGSARESRDWYYKAAILILLGLDCQIQAKPLDLAIQRERFRRKLITPQP
jgi:four helix bundle protein